MLIKRRIFRAVDRPLYRNKRYFLMMKGLFCTIALALIYVPLFPPPVQGISAPKNVHSNLQIPDSSHVQILTMKDGSVIIGRIIQVQENEIKFETGIGVTTVPVSKIKNIRTVEESSIKNGRYWFPNPNATRLFFSSTGRMLQKGDGYFSDTYIFFPGAAYGITDNITIGGGMSLFPGAGVDKQLYFFTPKVGIKATKNLSLAAGALIIRFPAILDNDSHGIGITYGVGTYGGQNQSVTFGLGYGFVDGSFANKPMVLIGGEKRLTRRIAFVSENWIFPGMQQPVALYGIRLFGESLSVDLAFLNVFDEHSQFPGIPYIDFVFKF